MLLPTDWPDIWGLLPLLYIEMHYRWFPGGSRYFRREPEILADLPRRIEPGHPIPLLLLVKDAHRYPILLESLQVEIANDGKRQVLEQITLNEQIDSLWWRRLIEVDRPALEGTVDLHITFNYRVRGRSRTCLTHNLPLLKRQPLQTWLANDPLPGTGVVWGDIHHHTSYTRDMIEYGAPLEAGQAMAAAMGLGFVCASDHSYDLDDAPGQWYRTDPQLQRWLESRERIAQLNSDNATLIIPGEEVTVNNSRRRNMHALVLDHPDYLPGSGDGGENPLKRSSELDLNALSAELGHGTLLIAPHPMYPLPWLQRFVVRRDVWQLADLSHGAVAGLQILNGSLDEGFYRGLSAWKGLLLAGERKFIYGGSDSHGDFNRFRTIKLPFISLLEDDSHVFGSCRTGVYGAQPGNLPDLLDGLRNGRCLVSTGPFMDMSIQSGDNMAHVGESITGSAVTISLTMASTPEFGPLKGWRLYRGEIGGDEQLAAEGLVVGRQFESNWTGDFSLAPGRYYFRAEVETKTVETAILPGLALTNPVWVEAK